MYNFKSLIKKYGKVKPKQLIETDGHFDYTIGGVWVDGSIEEVEFEGAVVPLGENVLKDSQAYTVEDKALYCYIDLEPNTIVLHKNIRYAVMEKRDFADFDDGLYIYTLKRGGQ